MWREDPLTGLGERGVLEDLLRRVAARVEREGIPVVCAVTDMDDFKAVNDTFGHAEGDRVLQAFGRYVRRRLRAGVHALRMGGDEFLFLFEGRSRRSVSRTIRRWIQDLSIRGLAGHAVGFSAGVAGIPEDTTDVYELLPLADQALYLAKARGKGTLAYPSPRRVHLQWPPAFVPRPVEQRILATLLRERPVVVIRGPEGSGKTRFVREVLARKAVFWDPGVSFQPPRQARVVVVDDAHRLSDAAWARVGSCLREGKTCVLVLPEQAFAGVQIRLQPFFSSARVGELHIPPMEREFPRLVERALGGVVPGGLTEDLFELSGGLPGLAGEILHALREENLLKPLRTHWTYFGIPPGFSPPRLDPIWRQRNRDLHDQERILLGVLGVFGGEGSLVRVREGASALGARDPEEQLASLEEKGWIRVFHDSGVEKVSLREKIWASFAEDLLSPERWRQITLWVLENEPHLSDMQRLHLLFRLDRSVFLPAYHRALREALSHLDMQKVQRLLLLTREESDGDSLIQEAHLWLLRTSGRVRELVRAIPTPPPDPWRWMLLDALSDLGRIEQALRLARMWENDADPALQAAVGWGYLMAGENDCARKIFASLMRRKDLHPFIRARAAYGLGEVARLEGRSSRAFRLYGRALDALRETRYVRGEVLLMVMQAEVRVQQGRLKDATRLYFEALENARTLDALDVEGYGSYSLGEVYLERGYVGRARKHLLDALNLFQMVGSGRFLPFVLDDLAYLFPQPPLLLWREATGRRNRAADIYPTHP